MTKTYIIYADGACSGNPGPGGWAYEIQSPDGSIFVGAEGSPNTTNNIMELTAAAAALEALHAKTDILAPSEIVMRLDSQYVLDGLFKWLPGWKAKGWKTAGKKPVKNRELWERLDAAYTLLSGRGFTFTSQWVKGHDGEPGNERVDTAAQEQRDRYASAPMSAILEDAAAAADIPVTDVPATRVTPEDTQMLMGIPRAHEEGNQPTPVGSHPYGKSITVPFSSHDLAGGKPDINPMQVDLMRTILDLHASGDYSIKKVIEQVRANAVALGCR